MMQPIRALVTALLLPTLFSLRAVSAEDRCARIVSLAPSVTETVLALGLGSSLVGVSKFCSLPDELKGLPRVGGFFDPNYERIVSLHPTVAIYISEFRERGEGLGKLSVPTLVVDQRTVSGIQDSVTTIGRFCGVEDRARDLRTTLDQSMKEVQQKTADARKVRTLVVVGSERIGGLKDLYVSGRDGFYDELISASGGVNVVTGNTKATTALAMEAIIGLDPEVIIEIHPDYPNEKEGSEIALNAWSAFPSIAAVKTKRIHVLSAPYSYIPGPQFPKLLRAFANLLHPELGGEGSTPRD